MSTTFEAKTFVWYSWTLDVIHDHCKTAKIGWQISRFVFRGSSGDLLGVIVGLHVRDHIFTLFSKVSSKLKYHWKMSVIFLIWPSRCLFFVHVTWTPGHLTTASKSLNANAMHLKETLCSHYQHMLCATISLLMNARLRFPCKVVWLLNGTSIDNERLLMPLLFNTDS